jgi:hypothetical protein
MVKSDALFLETFLMHMDGLSLEGQGLIQLLVELVQKKSTFIVFCLDLSIIIVG